jgi:hypothetical protein
MAQELVYRRRPAAHRAEHLFAAARDPGRHPAAREPLVCHLASITVDGRADSQRNA